MKCIWGYIFLISVWCQLGSTSCSFVGDACSDRMSSQNVCVFFFCTRYCWFCVISTYIFIHFHVVGYCGVVPKKTDPYTKKQQEDILPKKVSKIRQCPATNTLRKSVKTEPWMHLKKYTVHKIQHRLYYLHSFWKQDIIWRWSTLVERHYNFCETL